MKYIDLIKAYINKGFIKFDNKNEIIDLVNLSLEQSLQTILYSITNDMKYLEYYVSWVRIQQRFFALQNEITNLLNENKIKHLFFKGSVIAKIYDDPSVRTRGDIDLYVNYSDFEKAKKIFIDNGFINELSHNDSMQHQTFKKNNVEVELHFNMLDFDIDISWRNIFSNPFDISYQANDFLYQFDDTYHMLYCIMHFAEHLRKGAGIRYILDYYYMFKKTNIDIELLHRLISETKLNKLYSNIINELRVISDIDFDKSIIKEDVKFFEDYMLSFGIHGHVNNDTLQQASRHKHKLKYALVRILLLDKNYRRTKYPKLGKWYFMPICLLYNWWYLLTHKMRSFLIFLFGKNKNKKLYKKIGI